MQRRGHQSRGHRPSIWKYISLTQGGQGDSALQIYQCSDHAREIK